MDFQSTVIGAPVTQIGGHDKVTGQTRFAADVILPGMLWGKILRSPYPHARIRRIDASAAWSVPGVKAVVTGQDAPGLYFGKVIRDMPVLCWNRVRYIGDRVAAVAAETSAAAEEALLLIEVDYEVLPAVYDPLEAMQPGAPNCMKMSRRTQERRSNFWRRMCATAKHGSPGQRATWFRVFKMPTLC